ncbi:L-amino acid N-acyltransferase YncA [Rhodovulum iodosum]|uniref:L-amino acid N-acyltransferase YncA n=1 Tax=Rhodovulum iodosum TaxID=68291 RepID=A0ABV3XPY4_9RHOB|nr:GNAT family N-acetyltransferase [Rhodovulum robiginosum]RSK31441.1 N-acetyltransferase [Rhodovulum robiginosum]
MRVRAAGPGDAAAVAAIWNQVIRDTLITFNSVEKHVAEVAGLIAARQAAGQGFFVGEREGAVAGFATYGQFRAGAGYVHAMEHTVLLAPAARGRGLGRALMAALEAHAAAAGAHVMVAGISAANPGAVAFHAALGYAEAGRMAEVGRKAGRWLDLVLMQKVLQTPPDTARVQV